MPEFSHSGHGDRCPRMPGFHYGADAVYFITIKTAGRVRLFGRLRHGRMDLNQFGEIVQSTWLAVPSHQPSVALDAFVVMPDHFHAILCLVRGRKAGGAKSCFGPTACLDPTDPNARPLPLSGPNPIYSASPRKRTRGVLPGSLGAVIGGFKAATTRAINLLRITLGEPVWQSNYHDSVIRNERHRRNAARYILLNPSRA